MLFHIKLHRVRVRAVLNSKVINIKLMIIEQCVGTGTYFKRSLSKQFSIKIDNDNRSLIFVFKIKKIIFHFIVICGPAS